MIVAVAGASGFVGRNLIRTLIKSNHRVKALVHSAELNFQSDRVEYIRADIHNRKSLIEALKGVDAVIHLVGIIAETKTLTFQKTVIEGTENLVSACAKNGVKRIIYLSGLGTSANSETAYFKSKYKAERLIINSGIGYTIFRASVVFGPGDQFINMFIKMIKRLPVVPIIGNGRFKLQPLYVDELTEVISQSLDTDRARNRLFEIGGSEQISLRAIISIIKRNLNKKRLNIYLPLWFLKANAFLLEKIMKPAPVTIDQIKMLELEAETDNKEVRDVFDIELTSLEQNISIYMR